MIVFSVSTQPGSLVYGDMRMVRPGGVDFFLKINSGLNPAM